MSILGNIAFIVRKKTPHYNICIESLRCLELPNGYKVDLVSIEASSSIAADRQLGMHSCSAKYKIYIEDSIIILDSKFLINLLELFQNNTNIGLAGLIGTDIVPTNGLSISSPNIVGKIYDKDGNHLIGNSFREPAKVTKAVLGNIMATQYDLDWPEEYSGEVFYDTAHSLNYQRKGYKCAVLNSSTPLIWLDYQSIIATKNEQNIFLNEYSRDLYPLVSIIIPSYQRPVYLKEAITSVLNQTYRNLDIFVSDRSPNDNSKRMVREYFSYDSRLHYEHHPEFVDRNKANEYNKAYNNPKAEYVNWLMDDDLFAPDKIAKMIDVYRNNANVSLVSSYRKCIDSNSNLIPDRSYTRPLSEHDILVPGHEFAKNILFNQINMIGELSTCLIKKENLYHADLGLFNSSVENVLPDVSTWLRMCALGDVMYLSDPLSYVRIHNGQDQEQPRTVIIGATYWGLLLDYDFRYTNFLNTNDMRRKAIKNWLKMAIEYACILDVDKSEYYCRNFKKVFSEIAQFFANEKELDLSSFIKL